MQLLTIKIPGAGKPVTFKQKCLLLLTPLLLAGPAAYLQTTYTSTNVPAGLAKDAYTRYNGSLGTTSAVMTISYDNGGTIQAPAVATNSNIKMLVSASAADFSAASFIQADTVNTIAQTVTFHPPAGLYYTLAMSAAADLAIVSNGPASATPGATVSYKLEVTNTGPSDVQHAVVKMPGLSNITINSISASGMQFSHSLTPTSVATSYPAATSLQDTGITIPTIAAFGGVTIVITGTAGSIANSVINAGATITMPAGMTDLDTSNNTSAYSTALFTTGTLSRYTFNRTATLAALGGGADPASSNIDTAGNYHFSIVYTLVAGDMPIAPFGDTLKVPATLTAMVNKTNGAVNKWRGAAINPSGILYVQPYLDQGSPGAVPFLPGISLLEGLPYANTRGPVSSAINGMDTFMYWQINAGYYMPLGIYNFTLGAVPVATDTHVAIVNATAIVRGGGNENFNILHYFGYTSHNLGVAAILPPNGSASAPPDTVRPNASYPVVYHGYNNQGPTSYGKDRGYRIDDGMVTFSSPAVPLSLTLLSFEAQKEANAAVLHWQTAAEVNTRSFAVERSGDGRYFVNIGTVTAANIAAEHGYSFTDRQPLEGTNIYRLRMTDNSNTQSYSPARYLSFTTDAAIAVMPNPVHDVLYITNAPAGAWLRIANIQGLSVGEQRLSSSGEAVNMASYAPGTYIVQVIQNGSPAASFRVIKQ